MALSGYSGLSGLPGLANDHHPEMASVGLCPLIPGTLQGGQAPNLVFKATAQVTGEYRGMPFVPISRQCSDESTEPKRNRLVDPGDLYSTLLPVIIQAYS